MKFALALTCLALAACSTPARPAPPTSDECRNFNDTLVALTKRLETAGFDFGSTLGRQLASDTPEVAVIDNAMKEAQAALKSVETELAGIKVPDSAKAKAFHDAFKKFLSGQTEIINTHFKALADLALNANVSESDKQERTMAIVERAGAVENAVLTEVQAAQKAFALEFGSAHQ